MNTTTDRARIAQLWIHPFKSCAGLSVQQANWLPTGLEWDREWMVVDAQGEFVTQRECPQLALVQPRWSSDSWVLKAPGMLTLTVNAWSYEAETRVRIWNDEVPALDVGAVAGQWFSDFLAQTPETLDWVRQNGPFKLVRHHPDHLRVCDPHWTGPDHAVVGFADGFSVLVTSEASLLEFNRRLGLAAQTPVDMRRFRPNVVLSGLEPHGEDDVKAFHWGGGEQELTCRLTKPCPRCSIPEVNPETGRPGGGVTSVLSSYRSDARLNGALTFGMNGHCSLSPANWPESGFLVRVGDEVRLDFGF